MTTFFDQVRMMIRGLYDRDEIQNEARELVFSFVEAVRAGESANIRSLQDRLPLYGRPAARLLISHLLSKQGVSRLWVAHQDKPKNSLPLSYSYSKEDERFLDSIASALLSMGHAGFAELTELLNTGTVSGNSFKPKEHEGLILALEKFLPERVSELCSLMETSRLGETKEILAFVMRGNPSREVVDSLIRAQRSCSQPPRHLLDASFMVTSTLRHISKTCPELLYPCLQDQDAMTRKEIIEALLYHRDPKVVPTLISHAGKEKDGACRISLMSGLGDLADKRCAALFTPLLASSDKRERECAMEGLLRLKIQPYPQDVLEKRLRGKEETQAREAADMLEKLKLSEHIPLLLSLLDHPLPYVRAKALMTLGAIGNPGTIPAVMDCLSKVGEQQEAPSLIELSPATMGWHFLEGYGPAIIPFLHEVLKGNRRERSRQHAAEILGRMKDRSAREALRYGLKDPDWVVRSRCLDALGEIGDRGAIPDIEALQRDADERVAKRAHDIIQRWSKMP